MNKLEQIPFKVTAFFLCLISIGAYGQKQTKTYKESFKVTNETILDINTSHADIEFETWKKPEVSIEVTIEIDGVSNEEAEQYLKKGSIDIFGNSKKISILTRREHAFPFGDDFSQMNDFHFELPEIPNMDSLVFELAVLPELPELPELTETPPMPPIPAQDFDYEAFKKDGEKYLKKWQKEFSKGFNRDYEKKLEEWSERMDASREKMMEKRERLHEKRMKSKERLLEKQEKRRDLLEKRSEHLAKRHEYVIQKKIRAVHIDSINHPLIHMSPNIFYFSSDGENKNYKVKKTIKIKMPKATKIKMNVRHGEVKLAENTKNINATVSHASLLASTIEGSETKIMASYSPVSVQKWKYGQLQVNYSDHVNLKEVLDLRLSATSSDVVIDRLIKSAFIKNDLGPLQINSISNSFKELDVSLQNAEFECDLPSSSYVIYINGTSSKVSYPSQLRLKSTQNLNSFIHKGYHINKNQDRSITVNAKYSNVVLE